MKFTVGAIVGLLAADKALAFAPLNTPFSRARTHSSPGSSSSSSSSTARFMAMDAPPPNAVAQNTNTLPVISSNPYGQPSDVRYSDFLKLVNADKIEKVTFSADGTQLLGVDVDGARLKIESLPNDPELLSQLTSHKVQYSTVQL